MDSFHHHLYLWCVYRCQSVERFFSYAPFRLSKHFLHAQDSRPTQASIETQWTTRTQTYHSSSHTYHTYVQIQPNYICLTDTISSKSCRKACTTSWTVDTTSRNSRSRPCYPYRSRSRSRSLVHCFISLSLSLLHQNEKALKGRI